MPAQEMAEHQRQAGWIHSQRPIASGDRPKQLWSGKGSWHHISQDGFDLHACHALPEHHEGFIHHEKHRSTDDYEGAAGQVVAR